MICRDVARAEEHYKEDALERAWRVGNANEHVGIVAWSALEETKEEGVGNFDGVVVISIEIHGCKDGDEECRDDSSEYGSHWYPLSGSGDQGVTDEIRNLLLKLILQKAFAVRSLCLISTRLVRGRRQGIRRRRRRALMNPLALILVVSWCAGYANAVTGSVNGNTVINIETILDPKLRYAEEHALLEYVARTCRKLIGMPPNKGSCSSEPLKLIVDSLNATALATGANYLRNTSANVVCVHEHKLSQADIDDANLHASDSGWNAVWQPVARTEKDGTSGGVAIFVGKGIGIFAVDCDGINMHRWVTAKVEAPGHPAILAVSLDLATSVGIRGVNL